MKRAAVAAAPWPCHTRRMLPGSPQPTDGPRLILVGGGLANGLIALKLMKARPEVRITVLEGADRLGGAHTWSFFASDLTPSEAALVEPLIARRWNGYDVRFPGLQRALRTGYRSVTAERFDQVLRQRLGERLTLNAAVAGVEPTRVTLSDGRAVAGDVVVDGRGPLPSPELVLGWQKFVGQEVRLTEPHGLSQPIVMDATVGQADGYRFLYVLPFDAHTCLIEDTRYTDGPALDRDAYRHGIAAYAAAQSWRIAEVLREEEGVLPVALEGDIDAYWAARGETAQSGLRAALFHPTTGYSLPDAARLAERIAALPRLDQRSVAEAIREHSVSLWRRRGFYRLLNRMLFRAAAPDRRWRVMQRFYRLPEPLIERFYAAKSTLVDKLRIISGKPPVSVAAALSCVPERRRA